MCWIVFLRETGWKGAGKVMYRLDAMHKGSFFKKPPYVAQTSASICSALLMFNFLV